MAFTPLVRWKNFKIENLSTVLELFPKWHGEINKETFVEFMNNRLSSYGRTAYQFAGQLGLENRENSEDVKLNDYLDYKNSTQLKNYLTFWFKTYYGPNPYINGTDIPFIIYLELAREVLAAPALSVSYLDFLNSHGIKSGSDDILLNSIKDWGYPLQYNSVNGEIFVAPENFDRLTFEADIIDKKFPIPPSPSNKTVFFNRYSEENFKEFIRIFITGQSEIDKPHNRLLNGAPGTGKSHLLQMDCEKYLGNYENNMERVTFHRTYSYQQFVGTYKPVPDSSGSITYRYIPGPFLRLLVKAIRDYENNGATCSNYILIIEELNRAKNPDGVFGDVFQLLDRNSDGLSKYTIACSQELLDYLAIEGLSHLTSLYLPPNFYIWSTMNNADQGVQAIDSAFFRRWKPEYIDINHSENEIESIEVYIEGYGNCNWNNFRKELNQRLLNLGVKEDKLIGTFFIDFESLENNFDEVFVNKLLRYLFEDVMKFNRPQLFGTCSHFYEVVDQYKNHNVVLIDLDTSKFIVV